MTRAPSPPPAAPAPPRGGFPWAEAGLAAAMGCWILAFTPTPVALGTLPAFVAALALIERCRTTRRALLWVALFGAVAIGYGYRWLAATVREFGELDASLGAWAVPASWAVLALYGVAGTLHGLVFVVLYRRGLLRGGRRPHPLATVTLFAACEALPIRFLPWLAGYGAVEVAPLRQAAEWGGVHAVSFALLCLVAPFHEWLRWALSRGRLPSRPGAAAVTFAVGAAIYGVGLVRLHAVAREEREATRTVRVAIVQANVGSRAKRDAELDRAPTAAANRAVYERRTREAAARGAELVVWPETALVEGVRLVDARTGAPWPKDVVARQLAARGYGFLEEVGRDRALLLGGYEDEDGPTDPATGRPGVRRFNAAMLRAPDGASWDVYRKVRLIPFGETMPGASLFPGLDGLLPQRFKMVPGEPSPPPLVWRRPSGDLRVVAFVCYEAILPSFVADLVGPAHPDLLVNLTNDSWFGDTWEPRQHLAFSRFRAVEHRAPMVRATNTGISAFVDATGEVTDRLEWGAEGVLVRDVPLVDRGRTPWTALGGAVRALLWVAAALALLWARLAPASRPPAAA